MNQDSPAGYDQPRTLGTSLVPAQKFANGVGLPDAESTDRKSSESPPNSAQPAASDAAQMTVKMWIMVLLTGVGAGITSGLLMRLLRLVQHLSFSYSAGDFLTGVRNTSAEHRILVVSLGGVIAGLSLYLLRRTTGGSGADVTGAIWHKQGQFVAAPMVAKSLISIVTVGMGASIGREAALKDMGGTVAGKISDWTRLSPEQRHLLVACGAGAGMAAAYIRVGWRKNCPDLRKYCPLSGLIPKDLSQNAH